MVTHFHTAGLTSPKPPKHVLQPPLYYSHCYSRCSTVSSIETCIPTCYILSPCSYEGVPDPPPSRGETTTPTHTANQPFGNNYVHQIMVWPFIKATTFYCSVYCLADLYRLCFLAQCDYYLSTLESLPKVVTNSLPTFSGFIRYMCRYVVFNHTTHSIISHFLH